jgi:hypothetical protein
VLFTTENELQKSLISSTSMKSKMLLASITFSKYHKSGNIGEIQIFKLSLENDYAYSVRDTILVDFIILTRVPQMVHNTPVIRTL